MAKATPQFNLALTQDEAQTLVAILYHIGGDPTFTRRKFADSVRNALEAAGVSHCESDISLVERSIYFLLQGERNDD